MCPQTKDAAACLQRCLQARPEVRKEVVEEICASMGQIGEGAATVERIK